MPKSNDNPNKYKLVVLGATGSVGLQLLEVLQSNKNLEHYEVALAISHKDIECLQRWEKVAAKKLALTSAPNNQFHASSHKNILYGEREIADYISSNTFDICVLATPSLQSIRMLELLVGSIKHLWMANKEIIVAAGNILTQLLSKQNVNIYPIDSEHQALYHLLRPYGVESLPTARTLRSYGVKNLVIPCSGGPFWGATAEEIEKVTVSSALNHPIWRMGPKISIDSSTLMNKAFEIIEASFLFNHPAEEIIVVRDPNAKLHAAVEDLEGRETLVFGHADMRITLSAPLMEMRRALGGDLSFVTPPTGSKSHCSVLRGKSSFVGDLEFLDFKKHRAFSIALRAMKGGTKTRTALVAANDAAVSLFLSEKIVWKDIIPLISGAVDSIVADDNDLESIDGIISVYDQIFNCIVSNYS